MCNPSQTPYPNPYEQCPVFENDRWLIRFVQPEDAPDLLRVYSDECAVPFFNSDNCGGDDFHYTSLARMQRQIERWLWEYARAGFVRWTVVDRRAACAVGSVELFRRESDEDFFTDCGLLRLDVRSDYETEERLFDILSLVVPPAFDLFACGMVATKIPPFAAQRRAAAERLGFTPTGERLIGYHDRRAYFDYYILKQRLLE